MKNISTLTIGLGIVVLMLLFVNYDASARDRIKLDGVTLKRIEPDCSKKVYVVATRRRPARVEFLLEVEAHKDEKLESIHIYPFGKGDDREFRKKTCSWGPFKNENKICLHRVEIEFMEPDRDKDIVPCFAIITTESGKISEVEWEVHVVANVEDAPLDALINPDETAEPGSLNILDVQGRPLEKHINLRTGQSQEFSMKAESVAHIGSIEFYAQKADGKKWQGEVWYLPNSPLTAFEYNTNADFSATYSWSEPSKPGDPYKVTATAETIIGDTKKLVWTVSVTEDRGSAWVNLTRPLPRNQQVRLLPNEKQTFSITAESNKNIKSITFQASGADGDRQRRETWTLGRKSREFSTDYIWSRPGNYTVTATAETKSGMLSNPTTWKVSVKPPNRAPKVALPWEWKPKSIYVNEVMFLDVFYPYSFTDRDGDELEYHEDLSERDIVRVKWDYPNPKKRTTLTIFAEEPGTVDVTITATDPDGARAQGVLRLTVKNRGPVADPKIPNISAKQLAVGSQAKVLNLTDYFRDDDDDALTYDYDMTKSGVVSLQEKSGDMLHIIPQRRDSVWVTITATDGHTDKKTATQRFRVSVGKRNQPPRKTGKIETFPTKNLQNLKVSKKPFEVLLYESFEDPDGDPLTYKVKSNDNPSAIKAWIKGDGLQVKPNGAGSAAVTVIASDNKGGTAELVIKMTVTGTDANLPVDLAIQDFYSKENPVAPGATFELFASIVNKGGVRSDERKSVYFYRWDRSPGTFDRWEDLPDAWSDRAHKHSSVRRLTPGEEFTRSVKVVAPSTPGTYYYGAFVFPAEETDLVNNYSDIVSITVVSTTPLGERDDLGNTQEDIAPNTQSPDLMIESLSVSSTTVAQNKSFTLRAIVKNKGSVQSAATIIRYYFSTDNIITTSDIELTSDSVILLNPNGSAAKIATITVTAEAPPGLHYFGVCVDSVWGESNTRNNCSTAVLVKVTLGGGNVPGGPGGGPFNCQVQSTVYPKNVIRDQQLLNAILAVIPTGFMHELTSLNTLYYKGVSDLTGLEYATNLKELCLDSDQISDLTPLACLTNLSGLCLVGGHDQTRDFTPIENLTNLKWLELGYLPPNVNRAPLRRLKQRNPGINIDANINNVQGAPVAPVLPDETKLLSNYPNPFNPETWIPYQLSKDVEVTLAIYNVQGTLVRQLALGHQPAGFYHSRSRAVHWDGKNAFGERVASGVYFYTFTAGDFTTTGKMLILK